MPTQSSCEVNPDFIRRLVTGQVLAPQIVAQAMKEIADEIVIPDLRAAAPWLQDGEEGPLDSDHKTWVVTGHTRSSFVAYVPRFIENVFDEWDDPDRFKHPHVSDPEPLKQRGTQVSESGNPNLIALVIGRYATSRVGDRQGQYWELQRMETGEHPVQSWDPPGAIVEALVFGGTQSAFWEEVKLRIVEKFGGYAGARNGWIW